MFPTSQGPRDIRPSEDDCPGTPGRNTFIEPLSTPQGSPSKRTIPPGAHELPHAFDNALKLNPPSTLESPIKLKPQGGSTPLLPSKSNIQPTDDPFLSATPSVDNSIIHKTGQSPDAPIKKQGQENTPPARSSRIPMLNHNQAALSRHEMYQQRDSRPRTPTTKKFNTARGLTPPVHARLKKPKTS